MRKAVVPVVAVVVLTVLLTGCGGDGDSDDSRASPTTSAAVHNDTTFVGDPGSRYCQLTRTYSEASKQLTQRGGGPETLRQLYGEAARDMHAAVDAAPEEIKHDAKVVADGLSVLVAAFERVGWDPARLPPDALNAISTPEFLAAANRVDAYTSQVCGVRR